MSLISISKSLFLALILNSVTAMNSNSADNISLSQVNSGSIDEARRLLSLGDYKEAEAAYRHLISDDKDGSAYIGLIITLANESNTSEAEKCVRNAKERFPRNADLKAAAGFVSYTKAKQSTTACKRDLYLSAAEYLCQAAEKENPDSLIAHKTLGLTKVALSEPEEAVASFRKCANLARTPENLTNLAVVLRKSDPKNQEGAKLIKQALSLDKDYLPAHIEEAAMLSTRDKTKDALLALQQVPEARRDAQWSLVAGDIYAKEGDNHAAFASWNSAVLLDPYLSEAYQHMAEYYIAHGKNELAIAELHRGLEVNPNNNALRKRLLKIADKRKPNLELDPGMCFQH